MVGLPAHVRSYQETGRFQDSTYRAHLPRLLREHPGQFVLINADDVVGIFPDRSSALQDGYRRFGVVSFLVRESFSGVSAIRPERNPVVIAETGPIGLSGGPNRPIARD